jgi:tRNA (mo5U34)-methyltransferase
VGVGGEQPLDTAQKEMLRTTLMQLQPWRKGPFDLFGVRIDTEWHSDWKWDRLKDHIAPLSGRKVLDVGCGSGYHCWRMRGAGAELVLGIDPTLLFVMQFWALQRYIRDYKVGVLPLGIERLPPKLRFFDTVFSMGVLYHRRSPFDHLLELRDSLRPAGELVLETLVIDGNAGQVLVPDDRYARMNNVWFIPTGPTLKQWLKKVGFKNVQIVNTTSTTTEEQRATEWMTFQSLSHCLDPGDRNKTIEGYPAPKRAIIIAQAP